MIGKFDTSYTLNIIEDVLTDWSQKRVQRRSNASLDAEFSTMTTNSFPATWFNIMDEPDEHMPRLLTVWDNVAGREVDWVEREEYHRVREKNYILEVKIARQQKQIRKIISKYTASHMKINELEMKLLAADYDQFFKRMLIQSQSKRLKQLKILLEACPNIPLFVRPNEC